MKKYYLLSLVTASLIGATCIQCTSPKQKSGENTLPQKSELFATLPDCCPTPDGMAIAPNGDLILACPNFADITQPACLMRITKNGEITKWMDVPVLGKIEYTNLNDSGSRELLQGLLSDAGVSDGRIQGFFRRVWYLPKKKIYVNGNAAVKVCKGVDEQTAFQDEIFRIFGFF